MRRPSMALVRHCKRVTQRVKDRPPVQVRMQLIDRPDRPDIETVVAQICRTDFLFRTRRELATSIYNAFWKAVADARRQYPDWPRS